MNPNSNIDSFATIPSYNYLDKEPLFDVGLNSWSDGYKYIGRGSSYEYEAYLFRLQSTSLGSSHRWTFGEGTAASTIIGVIVGVTVSGLAGIPIGIVTSLVSAILTDTVTTYVINPKLAVKTIHNRYKTRVGNSHSMHYSFCRNQDYWFLQNWDTEELKYVESYEYKNFNHGLSMSNSQAIKIAIENYYKNEVVNRPCA